MGIRKYIGAWQKRLGIFSPITLVVVGIVAGIILWGGFNTAMEVTNTMEFCTSCHEMRNNAFEQYKQTIHYKNASGLQATCVLVNPSPTLSLETFHS